MKHSHLTQSLGAYVAWKQNVIRQLTRYRSWLQSSQLDSVELDEKLDHIQDSLQKDLVTIAFVGEFSRGKSELINALFFSQYGERILPSSAGRTTMCPTEIFYDVLARDTYVLLLPIETRKDDSISLRRYRQDQKYWVRMPLHLNQKEQIKETLAEVSRCKSVSRPEAEELNLDTKYLEPDPEHPGNVLIPAWRHALISFEHPLLRQGLTIIDTPGLNSLGSEPELTFSLLPDAHAVLLMLNADTGVTQSDLNIWSEHVKPNCAHLSSNYYAVLNKIDTLWDDLEEDSGSPQQLQDMCEHAAKLLEIPMNAVLPISAKQGLIAKCRGDAILEERSNLPALERLLSERIIPQKEESLQQSVVKYILNMTIQSMRALQKRLTTLHKHRDLLSKNLKSNHDEVAKITEKTKEEEATHHQTILLVRNSQRTLQKKASTLLSPIKPHQFDLYLKAAQENLKASWTTVGISKTVTEFFDQIEADFKVLEENVKSTNQLAQEIFQKFNDDNKCDIPYQQYTILPYLNQLQWIKERSQLYNANLFSLFKINKGASERFFDAIATETQSLYETTYQDTKEWCQGALIPILQSAQEHKKLISEQLIQLRSMMQENTTAKAKVQKISEKVQLFERQLESLKQISQELKRPSPWLTKKNVYQAAQGINHDSNKKVS